MIDLIAMLGLRFCARAFSSCGKWGPLFIAVRGPLTIAALSLSRPLLLWSTGSRRAGSVVVAHGPSCSTACGIFPDQGSNPRPLHWQADSQPLRHPGSPPNDIFRKHLMSASMLAGHRKENNKGCILSMSVIACKPQTWLHTQRLLHCPEWKAIFKGTPGIRFKRTECVATFRGFVWKAEVAAGEYTSLSPLEVWVYNSAVLWPQEKTSLVHSLPA